MVVFIRVSIGKSQEPCDHVNIPVNMETWNQGSAFNWPGDRIVSFIESNSQRLNNNSRKQTQKQSQKIGLLTIKDFIDD